MSRTRTGRVAQNPRFTSFGLLAAWLGLGCADPSGTDTHTSAGGETSGTDGEGDGDDDSSEGPVDLGGEPDLGGPDPIVALEDELAARIEAAQIPGLAACVVKDNSIAWCRGFGWADVEDQRPVDEHTVFLVASLSKPVTGTALMTLWEEDAFELNDDVDVAAGFDVANPNHPEAPITYRQLFAHTSSIVDNSQDTPVFWLLDNQDPPFTLAQIVAEYFEPGGNWYFEGNFTDDPPGVAWNYTNMGPTLLAYLAEQLAEQPYDELVADRLFDPLAMLDSSWSLADFDAEQLATPYQRTEDGPVAREPYGFIPWPAGGLRTTAADLGRLLLLYAGEGTIDGQVIVDADTIRTILRPAYLTIPYQSLLWTKIVIDTDTWTYAGSGDAWVVHDGNLPGVFCRIMHRPSDGLGMVILTNTDMPDDAQVLGLERTIYAIAELL